MPCKDVTELLNIVLDDADRLEDYRFTKRTCGQGVGVDRLLIEELRGLTAEEILAIAPEDFVAAHPVDDPIEEFLALKHLIAVQSALEVLTGAASGAAAEICAAAEISYEAGHTVLDAQIKVDLVTERIKSCGNCGGCGKERKRKVRPVFV